MGAARAELNTQVARALGLLGRFEEASSLLDDVESGGADHIPVVQIRLLLERGRLIRSSGDPAAAKVLFRDALAVAQQVGEEFLAVDAAHMLALVDPDRSEYWIDLALGVVAAAADPRTRRWAGSLHNNAGWACHDAGQYTAALRQFEAALDAYSRHGNSEQVRVARWALARALRSLGRFDEALDIQQQLNEQGPVDGYVHEELAELLLATGRQQESRQHAARAAALLGADDWFTSNEPERLARLVRLGSGG